MLNFKIYIYFLFLVRFGFDCRSASEPLCTKFSYDEQLLEKMVRVEFNVNNMEKNMLETEKNMRETDKNMRETEHNMRERELNMTETEISMKVTEQNMLDSEKNMRETVNIMRETEQNMRETELNMTETEKRMKETEKNLLEKQTVMLETQTNMLNTLSEIENKIKVLEQREATLMALAGKDVVAFHAYKVVDTKVANNEVIVFTKVIMNEGDGYSSDNGYFTAPINGIFYFNAHLCVQSGKMLDYIIVVNGQTRASGLYKPNHTGTCTSFSVTVRMRSGERAWVTVDSSGSSSSKLLYDDFDYWNYFSGFLIQQTD